MEFRDLDTRVSGLKEYFIGASGICGFDRALGFQAFVLSALILQGFGVLLFWDVGNLGVLGVLG